MVYQDVRLKILRRVSSKKSQSSGCCAGSSIKLPSFVQTALRNEIKEATEAVSFSLHTSFHVQHGSGSVLWAGQTQLPPVFAEAPGIAGDCSEGCLTNLENLRSRASLVSNREVHEAVEVAMQKLADLVKSYAKSGWVKSGFSCQASARAQFQHRTSFVPKLRDLV